MIGVLGDRETVLGFRLAGVKNCIEAGLASVNKEFIDMKDEKIVIVTKDLLPKIEKNENDERIIITIPGMKEFQEKDEIRKMVKGIIGEMKND